MIIIYNSFLKVKIKKYSLYISFTKSKIFAWNLPFYQLKT